MVRRGKSHLIFSVFVVLISAVSCLAAAAFPALAGKRKAGSELSPPGAPLSGAASPAAPNIPLSSVKAPLSGKEVPVMKEFDRDFLQLLEENKIPGAALTVSYRGRPVFSRAYGFADREKKEAAQPGSVFRIASLSKSITAIAILDLCQKGKLRLEQKAFELLKDLKPCDPALSVDPRIYAITVADLLQCSAGWNHQGTNDPLFGRFLVEAARDCTNTLRPSAVAVVRRLLGQRLDFSPGSNFVYSNVSYCILGLIIERASGMSYADYVSGLLLKPERLLTIKPGKTLIRQEGEVRYYPVEDKCDCILPNVKGPVSQAYGGDFLLEACPASFGWVASTADLVSLLDLISGEAGRKSPLSPAMMERLLARPDLSCWQDKQEYFGFGFEVSRDKSGRLQAYSRHGSLPGSMALMEHQMNGLSWAAAFNSRPVTYESCREQARGMIEAAVVKLIPKKKGKTQAPGLKHKN